MSSSEPVRSYQAVSDASDGLAGCTAGHDGGLLMRAAGTVPVRTDAGPKLVQLTLAGVAIADWPEPASDSRITFVGRNLDALALPARVAALGSE